MFEAIIIFLNSLIKGLGVLVSAIFSVLPTSPFEAISNSPIAEFLPTLNFFVPVAEILAIMQVWLSAVGIYYLYQIVLRWVKAIE